MDAYQAELHVVEATRDLGGMMLTRWADNNQPAGFQDKVNGTKHQAVP